MYPQIHVNYVAVAVAVVASVCFGFLWHGPLFGKKWISLMKMPADAKPDPKVMLRGMVLMVIGTFLTAWVLVYMSDVWRPSAWGMGADSPAYVYGFLTGLFTWLGFYVPMLFGPLAWEGKGWGLFRLNAAYHFINLQLIAMILAYLR